MLDQLRQELRPMLGLAIPVVLAELGWMAMGVVDTIMVGRIDAESIGAVSLGRALFLVVAVFGIGLLLGLDTLVSRSFGAGNLRDCHVSLLQGIYLSFFMALPLTALLQGLPSLLGRWGVDPAVEELTVPYLKALSWSALPIYLYAAFRRYLQAINLVRPVMIALVSANLINVLFNWVFIFGHLGAPALGAEGAGWATLASTCYMALFLLSATLLHDRRSGSGLLRIPRGIDGQRLRELLRLGTPAALQLLLEIGVFALATALASKLVPSSLAAHHIALTAASVTAMVPLGISSAAAVRVGQALGRRDPLAAARSGWTALVLGAGFMSLAAFAFVSFPRQLIRLFTTDPAVIGPGVSLLFVAAVFQLFDGIQMVATGALRGAGDTRTPMVWSLVGYWLLGLPVGYWLCFHADWDAVGLWVGLAIGLIVVGVVLLFAWWRRVQSLGAR
jgi:MATE family multidrug resistance protein